MAGDQLPQRQRGEVVHADAAEAAAVPAERRPHGIDDEGIHRAGAYRLGLPPRWSAHTRRTAAADLIVTLLLGLTP